MTPKNAPVDRVRVFRRDGTQLAEFKTQVERSWAIGEEGRAQFTCATRNTDIVNKTVLQFGNWILVQNDSLPAWVGVIDTPRSWTPRTVTVSCYSPEHVFGWRRGPLELVKDASPAGHMRILLNMVNAAEPTIITEGNLTATKNFMQETYNPVPLDQALKRLYERSLEEYQWRPVINTENKLQVFMDWIPSIGQKFSIFLSEGKGGGNLEAVNNILVEDGDIKNNVLGYGDGLTWPSKPITIVENSGAVFDYGLRQSAAQIEGATSMQMLKDSTVNIVKAESNPVATFQLRVLNVEDTFSFMGLGNVVNLQLQNIGLTNYGVGYEAQIRIVAMKYNPVNKNKLEITAEVVL